MAFYHTVFLAVFCFPPVCFCVDFGYKADLLYFASHKPLAAMALLPLFLMLPGLHVWTTPKHLRWPDFYFASVWLPLFVFIGIGGFYSSEAGTAVGYLENRDCFAFTEKRELYHAYVEAYSIASECDVWKNAAKNATWQKYGVMTGTPAPMAECEGYAELEEEMGRQLSYLKMLEARFYCAGICDGASRLWHAPFGVEAPACGLFAAQWLRGAKEEAELVLIYAVSVLIFSFPVVLHITRPVIKYYDDVFRQ